MKLFIAMILLTNPSMPDGAALKEYLKEAGNIANYEIRDQIISFDVNDISIHCALMPGPIPWEDLEGPSQTAMYWKDAQKEIPQHKAHLVVSASGEKDRKELAFYLTKAIECILPSSESLGVYWGAGTLVTQKDIFIDFSKTSSLEHLPLYLWIDFRCFKEDNETYSLFTTGMKELGFMEIEIYKSKRECSALVDKAFNTAHYLLDNGPILKNGDTIGFNEFEKIKILHKDSFVERKQNVYLLEH